MLLLVTERGWDTVAEVIANKAQLVALEDKCSAARDRVQLLLAAYQGGEKDTQLVVDQANIDLRGEVCSIGTSVLFIAVERGHLQVVDFLLKLVWMWIRGILKARLRYTERLGMRTRHR